MILSTVAFSTFYITHFFRQFGASKKSCKLFIFLAPPLAAAWLILPIWGPMRGLDNKKLHGKGTNAQVNRQTHKRTLWPLNQIGPLGWLGENLTIHFTVSFVSDFIFVLIRNTPEAFKSVQMRPKHIYVVFKN